MSEALEFKTDEECDKEEAQDAMTFYSKAQAYARKKGFGWLSEDFAAQALLWRFSELCTGNLQDYWRRFHRQYFGKENTGRAQILRATPLVHSPAARPVDPSIPFAAHFEGNDRAILLLTYKWGMVPGEIAELFGWTLKRTEERVNHLSRKAAEWS